MSATIRRMPPPPDPLQDPEKWESYFAARISALYEPKNLEAITRSDVLKRNPLSLAYMSDKGLNALQNMHLQIIELQRRIRGSFRQLCALEDFEDEWLSAGPDLRQDAYFDAAQVVCAKPGWEETRDYSPEITLAEFEKGGGQGFLDIIHRLDRDAPPGHYIYLDHPLVDELLELPKPWDTSTSLMTKYDSPSLFPQRQTVLNKMLYACLMVDRVMRTFYARVGPKAARETISAEQLAAARKLGWSEDYVRELRREARERRIRYGNDVCARCWKDDECAPGEKGRFKVCAGCKKAGRVVRYCSRDCQRRDWANGMPPHRKLCGKTVAELDALGLAILAEEEPASAQDARPAADADDGSGIPPPGPDYVRSAALQYQVDILRHNPDVDYAFVMPNEEDMPIMVPQELIPQSMFRNARNEAFASGNEACVKGLYNVLRFVADDVKAFGREGLRRQFKREFGIDIVDEPSDLGKNA